MFKEKQGHNTTQMGNDPERFLYRIRETLCGHDKHSPIK